MIDEPTDEQLVSRLKDGEEQALSELYSRYSRKLYAYCRVTAPALDPEDLVHDVFIRLIRSAGRFNPEKASFVTWLYSLARNRCIDLLRRGGKVKFLPLEKNPSDSRPSALSPADKIPDTGADVEKSAEITSLAKAVRECISELNNPNEAQAIFLYYTEEKVFREIGELFGKSISMVRKYLKSAEEKVKKCLERRGLAPRI